MLTLDYELSPAWQDGRAEVDLATADEMTLRYDCFLGDIVFEVDGGMFSTRWGWVPVLDFAMGLSAIARELRDGVEHQFEFTASEAVITFTVVGTNVRISASYTSATAAVPYADLLAGSGEFLAGVLASLVQIYPAFANNPLVTALGS